MLAHASNVICNSDQSTESYLKIYYFLFSRCFFCSLTHSSISLCLNINLNPVWLRNFLSYAQFHIYRCELVKLLMQIFAEITDYANHYKHFTYNTDKYIQRGISLKKLSWKLT